MIAYQLVGMPEEFGCFFGTIVYIQIKVFFLIHPQTATCFFTRCSGTAHEMAKDSKNISLKN